ncbi:MAG: sugar phosphate isomerase/epimerase [Acidobacteria bacterium]|nr:sugar phosphate isomerase/epimerase [Acidobacteriota bacterium]
MGEVNRRRFLERTTLGLAAPPLGMAANSKNNARAASNHYRFKLGMYLPELGMQFDEALAKAKEIGAEYVTFNTLPGETPLAQMSDQEVDRMGERVAKHNLIIGMLHCGNPFKQIHLADLELKTLEENPEYRKERNDLTRSMQIAARLGVRAVNAFTFAWPGEYSAGKPTWPMRWLTRGGVISNLDMEKLVRAFSGPVEAAERHGVYLVLSMMPWNYTNTTGNFRRLAERLGSRYLKVHWGPADNLNSGEADVATAGFLNVRPYLYSLHLKDLHVTDGLQLKFEYRPLGRGDVDYLTILRSLRNHRCDVILGVATHFQTPTGSREEAMRINYSNLKEMIRQVEADG